MPEKNYDEAAEWAEHEMTLLKNSKTALRDDEAADFGRKLVERSGGDGPVDPPSRRQHPRSQRMRGLRDWLISSKSYGSSLLCQGRSRSCVWCVYTIMCDIDRRALSFSDHTAPLVDSGSCRWPVSTRRLMVDRTKYCIQS